MYMYVPFLSDLGRSSKMHHFAAMLRRQSKGTIEVVGNVHEQCNVLNLPCHRSVY